MTHADIVALLDALATEAGAKSFWHGKQAQADINYNTPFPQAHLFLMPSRIRGGRITTQVAMCFYGLDKHENGSADSMHIQNEMDLLTQKFYGLFAEAASVELVDDVMDRVPVLRKGASIGTGYLVNFTLSSLVEC
ncbi:hypothetical protein [Hymenobacter cellulosivorans]|uniref:DUF3168 domain-containing protein n=1 Tax=Hymenobacter cellulosivorans TaxID=2932249 RepID=A0ABY4F8R4_9BACT|nr:hypothetical protein [Hymenobacter cellulosivorans]UOQ53065.1 hypothetical protein MUN80_25425 [Hymenobacter cellulosivorans]